AYGSFQLVSAADEPFEKLAPEFRYVLRLTLNRLAGEITLHGVVQCAVANSVWLVQSYRRVLYFSGLLALDTYVVPWNSLTNPEKRKGLADVVVLNTHDIRSGGKLLSNAQSCKLVHVHPEILVEKWRHRLEVAFEEPAHMKVHNIQRVFAEG
ncbi:hypothetical protein BJV82DRAFT_595254, partial [Fennellomyces sp. T-0311]